MSTSFDPELAAAEQAGADARQAIHRAKRIVARSREQLLRQGIVAEPIASPENPGATRAGPNSGVAVPVIPTA